MHASTAAAMAMGIADAKEHIAYVEYRLRRYQESRLEDKVLVSMVGNELELARCHLRSLELIRDMDSDITRLMARMILHEKINAQHQRMVEADQSPDPDKQKLSKIRQDALDAILDIGIRLRGIG